MFRVHVPVGEAIDQIRAVLETGFVNEGAQVANFQAALVQYLRVRNLVLMNSCTSALTVAFRICGVGPGTEVISTAMTCIATNAPIANLGAKIVWADIEPHSGSIAADDIERKITTKTKAICCVDWAGTPCNLAAIDALGKKYQIPVVQDAAHAFGATWQGRPISDFADFTCYSFQAIKHLSTGDGGALICRDDAHHVLARKLKWFGYDREAVKDEKGNWKGQRWDADIEANELGYKFNMNNISAAIGLSQLPHIDRILRSHRQNAAIYNHGFQNSYFIRPLLVPAVATSSYWVYTALVADSHIDRDQLLSELNAEGIDAGSVHLPNDRYTVFKSFSDELPGTREFARRQISLPCGWWLSTNDCKHIIDRVLSLCHRQQQSTTS